jgi:hypothetical protein
MIENKVDFKYFTHMLEGRVDAIKVGLDDIQPFEYTRDSYDGTVYHRITFILDDEQDGYGSYIEFKEDDNESIILRDGAYEIECYPSWGIGGEKLRQKIYFYQLVD